MARFALASFVGSFGCSDGQANGEQDIGPLDQIEQRIRGGTVVTGAVGVVDIFMEGGKAVTDPNDLECTGSMIAPNVVLTAAHCFDHLGAATLASGQFSTTIAYYDPASGGRIVFDSNVSGAATWIKYPTYTSSQTSDFPGGANSDTGLIVIPGVFTNTNYKDYKRIYADVDGPLEANNLRIYGAGMFSYAGHNDANLRVGSFGVENADTNHIIVDNQEMLNTCKGDSGGPACKTASAPGQPNSLELVAGVFSIFEGSAGDLCAQQSPWPGSSGGDNSAYSRINSAKVSWIEDAIGHSCPYQHGADLVYRRCFDLPLVEDITFEGRTQAEGTAIAMSFL